MSQLGQNAKYSERADNFRFAPMNGHHQARTPCRKSAMKRHARRRSLRRLGLGGSRGSPKNLLRVVNGSGTKIPAATWEAIDLDVGVHWGFRAGTENTVMRNRIDIDYSHSRAIVQEVGERLRASLKEDRELPASLRMRIDRLRQLERRSQPFERPDSLVAVSRLQQRNS